ncbi:MAG: hypothetical protein R2867_40585 [Caldilineaceae bacterium]
MTKLLRFRCSCHWVATPNGTATALLPTALGHLGDQLPPNELADAIIRRRMPLHQMLRQNYRERVQRIERLLSEYPDLPGWSPVV